MESTRTQRVYARLANRNQVDLINSSRMFNTATTVYPTMLDVNLFIAEKGGNPELIRESERRRNGKPQLVDEIIGQYQDWTSGMNPALHNYQSVLLALELMLAYFDDSRLTKCCIVFA
ncbi:Cytosolic seryl-tRNA synthetase [Coemansia sp. S17]|nr:Cytosolic seryl-tRNA synthetase [Coemansia sp. S17]